MPAEDLGQPDRSATPPHDKNSTPPQDNKATPLVPSTPAEIRHGGLCALTAILVAERKKRAQSAENAPASDQPSES